MTNSFHQGARVQRQELKALLKIQHEALRLPTVPVDEQARALAVANKRKPWARRWAKLNGVSL